MYLTRNGAPLDSITQRPATRDEDQTRYYKFLECCGSLMTDFAIAIKPKDWRDAMRYSQLIIAFLKTLI